MKNIVHIGREQVLEALRKHEELLKESAIWREEIAHFEEFLKQEKVLRGKAFARERVKEQTSNKEEK